MKKMIVLISLMLSTSLLTSTTDAGPFPTGDADWGVQCWINGSQIWYYVPQRFINKAIASCERRGGKVGAVTPL